MGQTVGEMPGSDGLKAGRPSWELGLLLTPDLRVVRGRFGAASRQGG